MYNSEINTTEWLQETLAKLSGIDGDVWVNILRLANMSKVSGAISLSNKRQPYILHEGLFTFDKSLSKEDFNSALKTFTELGIAKIDGDELIITDWDKYEL